MIKIQLSKKFAVSFFVCFVFVSCGVRSINRQGGNSLDSSDYFTSFLAKDGLMMYFVKPIDFLSNDKEALVDFTFKKQNEKAKDTVNVGISIHSKEKIESSSVKEIFIDNQKLNSFEIVFNEPTKKNQELRILSKTSFNLFKNYSDSTILTIKYSTKEEKFMLSNKAKKILRILKTSI